MGRMRHFFVGLGLFSSVFLGGATVAFYEEALPNTMNPLYGKGMTDYRAHELVFDRLYYHSSITNKLQSNIVASHVTLDSGSKIQLNLKPGIKWHDGEDFTARDVCFTVYSMKNKENVSQVAKAYSESIAGCTYEKKKPLVAVLSFSKVFHNPRERINFSVLPAHLKGWQNSSDDSVMDPKSDFSSKPVGTGPMKASKGRRAVNYTKYDNTHHPTNISSLSAQESIDPYIAIKTLLSAGVQGVVSVPPTLRQEIKTSDEVRLMSYDLRSWWFIAVNVNNGPLADKRVRQALNYALDRAELAELTVGADPETEDKNRPSEFVTGPFIKSSPYYNHSVPEVLRSDRAKVKSLMTAAGATDNAGRWMINSKPMTLKMGMHAPLDSEAKDLLNLVGNQMQQAGFDRNTFPIAHFDWNTKVVTGKQTDFDLLIGKWSFGLVEDVNALFNKREGSKGALNIFNYNRPEVNNILKDYKEAQTDTQAKDAYHRLHAYLAEDLPYLFLWSLKTKSAWRNEVRNAIITPYYYFTEFDGWKYN